jgi:microsomal dipeptidase-like Zn-dependent dipeptidase
MLSVYSNRSECARRSARLALAFAFLTVALTACKGRDREAWSGLRSGYVIGAMRTPVVGYADLHVHQFTNESMAGAWLHGSPTGPVDTAMPRCSGNVPLAPGRNHGEFVQGLGSGGPLGPQLLSQLVSEMAGADTGLHANRRHGYCQAHVIPGPGLCRGNAACNLLSQSNCTPTSVCEWRSLGSICRDKPGDGISVGTACNFVSAANCENTCSWSWLLCRGNAACNLVSKKNCGSNVCSMQSLGSICRDREGDGKGVGLACNTLGSSACAASCGWDANWGSITLHAENRAHDWARDGDKSSWPAWDVIAHQQVHTSWLYQAYQDGLRLMVMSALNNEAFCRLLPHRNRATGYGCGDMENVVRQLDAAIALGADPNTSWYQIAYSAAEARNIINSNKLAVVLSVEASDIFNPDPLVVLQTLYDKGARTLQPLHQFNSRIGGVAWHDESIKTLQTIKYFPDLHHLCKTNNGTGHYAKCDATLNNLNYVGLTRAGKRFVSRMLNLGMPVDIAHMSERSVRDVETIVTAACNFPSYVSHGHVRSLLDEDSWKANKKHEKTTPDWQLDLVRRTGGMFGLRTGADHHEGSEYFATMETAGLATSLPRVGPQPIHKPIGKAKIGGNEFHFAYALDYLFRFKGVSVALGSDLNGLIPQMVFSGEPQDKKMAGLAHIGKLAVALDKLQKTGLDAGTFKELKENSAEAYLQMWERAADFARGGSCCPAVGVTSTTPNSGGGLRPVLINGAGFTPHVSMQVSVRTPTSAPIACTDVEFVSSSQLLCTMPPLSANTWYDVTVRNDGCGLESTKQHAYYARP